jgi:hypothetical protein
MYAYKALALRSMLSGRKKRRRSDRPFGNTTAV